MIVLDASAAVDGLLDPSTHPGLASIITGAGELLAAPDLLDIEVMSVLRRWERRRELSAARARKALDDLQALPVLRYPARAIIDRAWDLRHTLSACDAQYVALAQTLPAALLTTDERMTSAAVSAGVRVVGRGSGTS